MRAPDAPAFFVGPAKYPVMRRLGLVAAIVSLALLLAGGYTASAGAAVYQDLDGGRQALVAAQASMTAAARTADPAELRSAAAS
jgi:hypothetical protein